MNIKAVILKLIAEKSYKDDFRPETFKKILIVRTAKIGDTICLFPLIRELKKAYPSVQIDIYASTITIFCSSTPPTLSMYIPDTRTAIP